MKPENRIPKLLYQYKRKMEDAKDLRQKVVTVLSVIRDLISTVMMVMIGTGYVT
jgi:hypothetical protein